MRPVLGSGLQGKRDIVTTALDSGLWSGGAAGAISKSLALTDKMRLAQPMGVTGLAGGRLMITDSEVLRFCFHTATETYTSEDFYRFNSVLFLSNFDLIFSCVFFTSIQSD